MVNQKPLDERDNRTLVVGLGQTGLSVARFLHQRGIPVVAVDSRQSPPCSDQLRALYADVPLVTGSFDPQLFATAERLVVSPGVSIEEPVIKSAQARGCEIIGDIELFAREAEAPIVAITGSNGKSTVTTLLGDMARAAGLKVAVGGNIGTPALDLLDDEVELYVLELSSFQLETTHSLSAKAAVVLNISADHLDRYADLQHYVDTKAGIYQSAGQRIFNLDDPAVMAMGQPGEGDLFFTLQTPAGDSQFGLCQEDDELYLCRGLQRLLRADQLHLHGKHNLANGLAALSLGTALGLPMPAMLEALRNFTGLPHRTQFVTERAGVRWYNDSKATNVGACIAALEGFAREGEGKTVLLAGGECKDADFADLAAVVEKTTRAVVLMGRDAPVIDTALKGRSRLVHAQDMATAVAHAAELAKPGDRVLLSPACASFDMFKGFAHRGEVFMDAVMELGQ